MNRGRDRSGATPLMAAIRHAPPAVDVRHERCRTGVLCRLEHAARRTGDRVREALGRPAITRAGVYERHLRVVALLLEHGADPNAVDARTGAAPLSLAVRSGHDRLVRLLLDRSGDASAIEATAAASSAASWSCPPGGGGRSR